MSKKKPFKIDQSLIQGIADSIGTSQSNATHLRTETIPLERVKLDPENPRDLVLTVADITNGISDKDAQRQRKIEELEELKEFSNEIKEDGLIQPITVFKEGDNFMLIAGERRTLACAIASLNHIPAIIRSKPASNYKLSRIQWNENLKRKDLNLWERLLGIKRLIDSYLEDIDPNATVNATLISKLANFSLPLAMQYHAVLNADKELQKEIETGKINSLKKANLITNIKDADKQKIAIKACVDGQTLEELEGNFKVRPTNKDRQEKVPPKSNQKAAGRTPTQIIIGKTKNTKAAKTLFSAANNIIKDKIPEPNWENITSINKAFRQLMQKLEESSID